MRKFALMLALLSVAIFSANAETKNDTIRVESAKVEKLVEDASTDSKGNPKVKYYVIYEGELIPTSKSVAERYKLCEKHGAKCRFAIVTNAKTKRRRMILN